MVYVTNIEKLLQLYCSKSPAFASGLVGALMNRAGPLRVVLYLDETTSGNVLNPITGKKCWLIYISFLELCWRLSSEAFWLTAGVICHDKVNGDIDGGLSHVIRNLLLRWSTEPAGILSQGGFVVSVNGQPHLVRLQMHGLISDEQAMKLILQCKGAAGTKPCQRCYNVISKRHGKKFGLEENDVLRDITESNPNTFLRATDEDIFRALDSLAEICATQSTAEAERQQKIYGWNWMENGLLAETQARSILSPSKCHFDFLHILFSNGVASRELTLFWEVVTKRTNIVLKDLTSFANGGYTFRKSLHVGKSMLKKLFDPRLMEKTLYSGDASQTVLALYIMEVFADLVVGDLAAIAPAKESLFCLRALSRWYFRLKAKKCRLCGRISDFLIPKVSQYIQSFVKAYGGSNVVPKHHFAFHAAESMDQQASVLDTWVHERKHRLYKDVARNYPSNETFESSVLVKLLAVQELELCAFKEKHLEHKQSEPLFAERIGATTVFKGNSLHYLGQTICAGDICLFDNDVQKGGRIISRVEILWSNGKEPEFAVLMDDLNCVKHAEEDPWHFSEWTLTSNVSVFSVEQFIRHMLWPTLWWQREDKFKVSC